MAKVSAFPTAGAQPAVIVDLAWLQDALARQSQPPLPVTQWWLRTERGGPAGLPPGAAVTSRAAARPACWTIRCRTCHSWACW